MSDPVILPAGDQALVVEFSKAIDPDVNARVIALDADLRDEPISGVVETAPTYRSLLVCYDPEVIRGADLALLLLARGRNVVAGEGVSRLWHVPVLYGHEAGLDLDSLAEMKGLKTDEIIAVHCGATYRVYMIGFVPGYAYLGGLPEILHTPRLKTPRQFTAAGGIAVGGMQASVGSVASPSGWRFLGRTPLRTFDPARATPFALGAGDLVRFFPITPAEAQRLDRVSAAGGICAEFETV